MNQEEFMKQRLNEMSMAELLEIIKDNIKKSKQKENIFEGDGAFDFEVIKSDGDIIISSKEDGVIDDVTISDSLEALYEAVELSKKRLLKS